MKFAFAGIDFLGGVFEGLLDAGWTPVKLFTRPCDGIYDHNEVIVARARALRLPIQLSRIRERDIEALQAEHGRDWALVVAGYPWLIKGWKGRAAYGLNIHPSPLPTGRGPYPLFRAVLDRYESWGVTAHVLADGFDTGDILAQDIFGLSSHESHETLLAKCQMAARRLAAGPLGRELPARWRRSEPQGDGSYWPRATDFDRTLDFRQDVATVLRRVRAFGTVETIARLGDARVFVAEAQGWPERHAHTPGTVVHRHRRHVVVAALDGYVQLTRWSPVPLAEAGQVGR
ncbi:MULTISPECIES: formyltransferase family protein [Methylobacterium]|jgi:methionyl-tRNA formyltransferase|uniref:formyltransferase family protein n=1 Tax=Methylobacterium TaxID=407 RepID=UPI0005BAE806|nr:MULTISPECIES: formyltransferase family protein [unclassified Methylobacterium]MBP29736.1 formyl transferase [Methylobacterium sp.]MDE4910013.1 formyltransferase family protein [Methylobacterium sp. 092160098-2]SFU86836.1 methionyl-tRNA formyltransferase [Methylobacterium sp. UNCCL125]